MNDMADKVAEAIATAMDSYCVTDGSYVGYLAREAMAAMRNPTQQMTEAGMQVSMMCVASWQAMMDEALKKNQPQPGESAVAGAP